MSINFFYPFLSFFYHFFIIFLYNFFINFLNNFFHLFFIIFLILQTNQPKQRSNLFPFNLDDETSTRKPFESTDQQISHLKFDDDTDRIVKYRLKSEQYAKPERKAAYLQSYGNPYRYPISDQNEDVTSAIQLKRSYPKNYQQYRLLRSRLPRDRPTGRTAKELVSSSTKDAQSLSNGRRPSKESLSRLRMGRILSSKIISLKDNEQIASTRTTDQRINFRSELLPKVNIAYNNLVRRAGLLATDQQHQSSNGEKQQSNQLTEQANVYTAERYSNQTANNSTSKRTHPNDVVQPLTDVSSTNRNVNTSDSSSSNNEIVNLTATALAAALQNSLSSDASSIRETTQTLRPPTNRTEILNLIRNQTIETDDDRSSDDDSKSPDDLTDLEELNELKGRSIDDELDQADQSKLINEQRPQSPNILKAASMLSPLELHLIKLSPTNMIANRI